MARDAKAFARERIVGLFSSPLTPYTSELQVDQEALAANIEHILGLGVEGIGYGHSDPWCLSHAERVESTRAMIQAVGRRVVTYAHTHDHSAPETVSFTNQAAEDGLDLVMIEAPYEHAKSERMIYDFFRYVAERTDIGIIVLNTPHSGRLLSPELLDRLADIEAVCALKDGINDFSLHVAIHRRVSDRMVVSLPREEEILPCIMLLDQQVQLGTSAVYLQQTPEFRPVRAYFDLARAGRIDEAWKIWSAMEPMRTVNRRMLAPLWSEFAEHPIPVQKVWMDAIGMYGGPVRSPMTAVAEAERREWTELVTKTLQSVRDHPDLADVS